WPVVADTAAGTGAAAASDAEAAAAFGSTAASSSLACRLPGLPAMSCRDEAPFGRAAPFAGPAAFAARPSSAPILSGPFWAVPSAGEAGGLSVLAAALLAGGGPEPPDAAPPAVPPLSDASASSPPSRLPKPCGSVADPSPDWPRELGTEAIGLTGMTAMTHRRQTCSGSPHATVRPSGKFLLSS